MPIPNSDFVPDPFPGVSAPTGTSAPGTPGASSGGSAGPVVGTARVNPSGMPDGHGLGRVSVQVHAGDTAGASNDVSAAGTAANGATETGMTSTGAGSGGYEKFRRYPWQQKPGGSR